MAFTAGRSVWREDIIGERPGPPDQDLLEVEGRQERDVSSYRARLIGEQPFAMAVRRRLREVAADVSRGPGGKMQAVSASIPHKQGHKRRGKRGTSLRSNTRFVPVTSVPASRIRRRFQFLTGLGLLSCLLATPAAAQQQDTQQRLPQVQAPEPENIENMFSIGYYYWRPDHGGSGYFGGKPSLDPARQRLDLPSPPARANAYEVTIPTGGNNRLEVGYWKLVDSGQIRATRDLEIYGANITNGEGIQELYNYTNLRIAWNYLSYPVPPLDSRFRIKSFWEVQYFRARTQLAFPDQPDINGNIPVVQPKESIKLPGVGIGAEYIPNRSFRVEGRISGMGLPGRSRYIDAQVTAVGRIANFVEFFGGIKGYHFRTSPRNAEFIEGTLWGPFFGMRFVLN